MAISSVRTTCGECKTEINESPSLSLPDRQPYPNCGSLSRLKKLHIEREITPRSFLKLKGRGPTGGKPFLIVNVGAVLQRASGRRACLERSSIVTITSTQK
jgi:hypothetical protein